MSDGLVSTRNGSLLFVMFSIIIMVPFERTPMYFIMNEISMRHIEIVNNILFIITLVLLSDEKSDFARGLHCVDGGQKE